MPLYTDPGYSYYSSSTGSTYSPYYTTPLYGSSSSSAYAPYSSTYNRSFSGTYTLPSTSRSNQYTSSVSRYHPKLSTITESPLTSRSNFIPLSRIQSPKVSTYSPTLSTTYISARTSRPKNISTADIDVSASSRYGRHHHMDNRPMEEEKADEAQATNNTDSDTSSSIVDPNSPFMPRVDGTDTAHHARSTIKRNRAVVRLSIMRPRSRKDENKNDDNQSDKSSATEPTAADKSVPPERFYISEQAKEEGLKITVTDIEQSKASKSSLSEMIIEVDPLTNIVRRLSVPQVPSFHDICEDISSDKIDDDLNAGVLRRRASLIQEQEIEILNELQKSQSGSIQVIHLERNVSQEDCRKSRKSKKVKKIRHKITAKVEVDNPPLTPVIQSVIEEENASLASPTVPKFTFNIEDIEEHKIFKLPKKRVKSIKSKKVEEKVGVKADAKEAKKVEKSQIKADQLITEKVGESQMKIATPMTEKALESEVKVSQPQTAKVASKPTPLDKPVIESKIIETQGTSAKLTTEKTARKLDHVEAQSKVTKTKPSPLNKTVIESSKLKEAEKKVATPKPIKKIEKSESGVDFWSEIDTRESWYMDKRKKIPLVRPEVDAEENPTQVPSVQEMPIDKRKKVPESKTTVDATPPQTPVVVEKPATLAEPDSNEDFWSQIDTRESLYMNKRKKSIPARPEIDLGNTSTPSLSQTTSVEVETESNDDFWAQIDSRESLYTNKRKMAPLVRPEPPQTQSDTEIPCTPFKVTKKPAPLDKLQLIPSVEKMPSSPTKIKPSAPRKEDSPSASSPSAKKALTKPEPLEKPAPMPSSDSAKKLEPSSPKTPTVTSQEKSPSNETSKKDDQPPTPKKTSTKPQDSPKTKNPPKLVAKKKSSPKNDAKEETAAESNSKPKAKPSASTTNEESIASTKINSGSGAKSPEKNKTTVKSDKQSITTKNATHTETEQKIPEISHTKPNDKQNTPTEKLKKSLAPTNPNQNASAPLANAKSDAKSGGVRSENANVKQTTCDTKMNKPTDTPPLKKYATSLTLELSPVSSPTTPETLGFITSPFSQQPPPPPPSSPLLSTPKPTADASTAQVLQPTTSTATTTKNSSPTPTAASTAPSSPTTKTIAESDVLASGGNNLSKFATISNLAQYLLDVDAEVEDYIPSSADESDSSSDSYSVDGSSLSASMKKKNKLMKKKAKEQQQAFDPNKKIKIDTKKKCYVKEEAPRYPLVATPRPLWKREKVTYEESSNSSSEETDSESECTTSDEYEDELCPKDAIIRMSTCSNDSGFDGGTAPATGKKVLETSYTYLQFQKSGRITAPATTIPRFKKYSVEDFHFLAVLGKGSFGKVLLAELRNTDFYYAVKCLKKDVVLEDDDVECTLIERKVLALGTKHPYLCHLFCTFQTESHLFFVMEYLNGGDLMFHIQESGRFPEDRARFYGAEIISGLKFLHKKGIIYRDLKLDNVLLDFDGHVRIADFGMCKLQIYLDKTADSFCGTPDYMAPEIIKGDKYNQNVDWWSFGVLLYEMLIGQSPFSGCDEDELFWSICNEIPWFPVYITQEATSILKGLLEKDYTRRVGSQYSPAGDICDHIFFKEIDWGLLEKRQLPPPFKPQVKHPLDTQYFDRAFTRERVRLTPIDKEILQSMDQEQFQGFSYTNPNATLD